MGELSFMTFDAPQPPVPEDEAPGQSLAAAFVAGLEARGIPTLEPLCEHGSYGWCFVVGRGDQRVWCMLQLSDNWLFVIESRVPLLKRLLGKRSDSGEHRRVCEALHAVAVEHPEVSNVRWLTREEFEAHGEGTDHP